MQDLGATFDVVSCIGATWIGNGLSGTLAVMKRLVNLAAGSLSGRCTGPTPTIRMRRRSGKRVIGLDASI